MWHEIVSSLDSTLQMMLVGLSDAWGLHPFAFGSIVIALLLLAVMLWAEVLDVRDIEYVISDVHRDAGAHREGV